MVPGWAVLAMEVGCSGLPLPAVSSTVSQWTVSRCCTFRIYFSVHLKAQISSDSLYPMTKHHGVGEKRGTPPELAISAQCKTPQHVVLAPGSPLAWVICLWTGLPSEAPSRQPSFPSAPFHRCHTGIMV